MPENPAKPTPASGALAAAYTQPVAPPARRRARTNRPAPATQSTSPAADTPTIEPAPAPEVPPRAPTASRPQRPGAGRPPKGTVRRHAQVPIDLHEKARMHCASTGHTLTQMILLAVTAAKPALPDLLAADDASRVAEPDTDQLFTDLVIQAPKPPTKPMVFYPSASQLDILDALVEEVGADDRSRLISVSLRSYLH